MVFNRALYHNSVPDEAGGGTVAWTNPWGQYAFHEALHYNLIVRLLNDRFGVQARGGGSCAGTYGHYLLHVDPTRSKAITDRIDQGDLSEKPGWVQLSFHPTTTTAELTYALGAVEQIATHGARWAEDSLYDPHTNEFVHRTWDAGWRGVVQEWFAQVGRVEVGWEG